jgi:spore coat protein A
LLNLRQVLSNCLLLLGAVNLLAVPNLPGIADPLYLTPVANPDSIPKFVKPMPVVKQLGIRVDAITNHNLTIRMEPTAQDLLGTGHMTVVWGYGVDGFTPVTYPGSTLITKKDVPVTITFINNLGFVHPMPMDTSFMWAFSDGPYTGQTFATNGVPAVVHLHGGHTDADFDGTPEQWFTPKFHTAPSAVTQGPKFVSNVFTFDNSQEAATLWYHDHALGVTRLNTYMGLAEIGRAHV